MNLFLSEKLLCKAMAPNLESSFVKDLQDWLRQGGRCVCVCVWGGGGDSATGTSAKTGLNRHRIRINRGQVSFLLVQLGQGLETQLSAISDL